MIGPEKFEDLARLLAEREGLQGRLRSEELQMLHDYEWAAGEILEAIEPLDDRLIDMVLEVAGGDREYYAAGLEGHYYAPVAAKVFCGDVTSPEKNWTVVVNFACGAPPKPHRPGATLTVISEADVTSIQAYPRFLVTEPAPAALPG